MGWLRGALIPFALAAAIASVAAAANQRFAVAGLGASLSIILLAAAAVSYGPLDQLSPIWRREFMLQHPAAWTVYCFLATAAIVSTLFITLLDGSVVGVLVGIAAGLYVAVSFRRRLFAGH
jgi:hypothetical protein